MAFNYSKLLKTANKLITNFGAPVTVRRPGGVERINGNEVITPESSFQIVGVLTEYKAHEIDGSRVLVGDMKFLAKADPAVAVGDILDVRGGKRVVNAYPLAPAGMSLLFEIQLRG
jgi:hypothetical protein